MAELDGRMADVYLAVQENEFDNDMCEEERSLFYWLLRLAYACGRQDGYSEMNDIYNPKTYAKVNGG